MSHSPAPHPVAVAALYCFAPIADCAAVRRELVILCRTQGVRGTLILASEGINGTIAGPQCGVEAVVASIHQLAGCARPEVKWSGAASMPFHRLKVRIKREIVTMGQPDVDARAGAGRHVAPEDWNALIDDPATVVIDTRNAYEVAIGSFAGAIDPGTANFSQFPAWFEANRARLLDDGRPRRVAMFCTGGIRCEKSTAFLRQQGVEEVYHLKGGILAYLEKVPESASRWAGECFVFDQRVAVGHGLAPGSHALCHACRLPVSAAGRTSPLFEDGVSCAACHETRSDAQRASARERHRQQALAESRGTAHVGAAMRDRTTGETCAHGRLPARKPGGRDRD